MFFLKSNRSLFFLLDIDDWVYIINKYQKSLINFVYILRYLNHFSLIVSSYVTMCEISLTFLPYFYATLSFLVISGYNIVTCLK